MRGWLVLRRLQTGSVRRLRAWVAVLIAMVPLPVQGDSAYEVESEPPVSLRALLDVRLVRPGLAPSWRQRGPGKTRYGGIFTATGFEHVTRFALAQLALEPAATLPGGIRAYADLNWAADIDTQGHITNDGWPRLVEAWLRKEWRDAGHGWALQGGVTNAPFTPENTGPAWMPRYTLTPSALSSWLWEEGRVVGAEGEWWHETDAGVELGAVAGFGWGPDQMGILLAQRGWVLDDDLAGVNSALPLPQPGKVEHVFDERDGRPALYAGASVADPWQVGRVRLGYYDNLGDEAVQGVWEARYGVAGVTLQPLPGLDVLFQYLLGTVSTRTNALSSTVSTWYPLVSYRYRNHRLSVRYDRFRVDDDDTAPSTWERGDAVTLAYMFEFWLRHRLAFEHIWLDSHRPTASAPNPSDDIWQLSYRFRY